MNCADLKRDFTVRYQVGRQGFWGRCRSGLQCRFGLGLLLILALWGAPAVCLGQLAQSVTFLPQPPQKAFAGTSILLQGVATSGLPVTFSVVSGPAQASGLNGSTLTYTGVGSVMVQADQAGGNGFSAAPSVQAPTIAVQLLTEPVNQASASLPTLVTFTSAGMLARAATLTQGAVDLDFKQSAGTPAPGTVPCQIGALYSVGQTCTLQFTFTPTRPGIRYGGITLSDANGNLLANAYIYGYGVGPQVLYAPIKQTLVGNSLGQPSGVAVNGTGDLFVSNETGDGLTEIAVNGNVTPIGNFINGRDVAVDGSGNVFLITFDTLYEITAVNGAIPAAPVVRILTTGLTVSGGGLAIDGSGNAYIADSPIGSSKAKPTGVLYVVYAVNGSIPSGSVKQTVGPAFAEPTGVAVDSAGNVYISDGLTPAVLEMLAVNGRVPGSPVIQQIGSGYLLPTNIRLDDTNDIFISDARLPGILELAAVNGVVPLNAQAKSLGSGFINPQGLLVDDAGNVFVADAGYSQVVKLNYSSVPTLTFTPTLIGSTSTDSPQAVTYTNVGNAPLIFNVPATGSNPTITADFTLNTSSSCPRLAPGGTAANLDIGQSCTDQVSFTPSHAGPDPGTLTTVDNDLSVANATQIVKLNGVGLLKDPNLVFSIANHFVDDPPFGFAATSDSPGALTYNLLSGPATINGTTLTLTGVPGTVMVQASQAAIGIYAATTRIATFSVSKHPQTINFVQPPSPVSLTTQTLQLNATASSGLPVTFSIVSGPATVRGATVTFQGGGTLVIAADQAGNAIYAAAPQVTRMVIVSSVTVALSATPNPVFLNNPVTFTATLSAIGGTPTGSITFLDAGKVLATVPLNGLGATLTISTLSLGVHPITALYSGDSNFTPATSPVQNVLVQDLSFTLASPDVTIVHGGTGTFALLLGPVGGAGTASSVTFTVTGTPDQSTVSFTPQSVPAGSGPTPVTLVIATPNYPVGPFATGARGVGLPLALAGIGLLVLPWRRRKLRITGIRSLMTTFVLVVWMAATSLLSGCGSGWKTQRYALNITATSGQLQRSVAASLTTVCKDGHAACPVVQ